MSQITDALVSDIGGDPSAGQRLIIANVAVKAAKLHLLQEQLLNGSDSDADPKHVLAWSNSMRLDLVALGLERRMRELPSLGNAGRIEDHFTRPYHQDAAE